MVCFDVPVLRPLVWLGNTRKILKGLPSAVQKLMGDELQLIQYGGMPKDAKSFKGVGSGVFELALRHDKEAYRSVLAVQLGRNIYVLHVFHKKSKKGIATPQQDIDLIKQRYRQAQEIAHHEK